ncbi:PAS domain-containing protein [Lactonifactor longoviformis]|uniref:Stage 0 sporulation protein A homolog n=1 Tax=Lactonifactor longoviformis DSM 17459 TaxID=1122155 RepID=A0A1M4U7N5_9CLOT|nr:response regulator [Lactonifactor longoviformis]POP31457.1 PAS domain-containing protein [Lactonifactor longoviformis]SHE52881.1 Signal transduction histidine kinase [Lactonifactor longoviformis DSM 17459]
MDKQKSSAGQIGYEYDTLMNLLHVSVSKHLLDDHFTLVWANDFYYELIGYNKEEYQAAYHNLCDTYYMNDELGIHDEELWNQIGEEVIRTLDAGRDGYTLVAQMRRRSGEYIWVRMSARFTDEYIDGYRVSYTAMMDVSDIMRMEQEQSVTYDNLPGFIAKYKVGKMLDFTLLDGNDRFFAFFGKESWKNMEYPLFRDNVLRNQAVFEAHREALLKGEQVHFTVHMSDQRGQDAWLQINGSCVGYQDGDPVYLVIYIDITNETELRQMQRQLEDQAEKLRSALKEAEEANRAKSDFLSRMSHDIRTPMNAILGMKDIAVSHMEDPDKVKDCLKKIGLSGQHLLGLINDVLDMSKIESGEMALRDDVVSLPEVLENIVTIMQPQFKERDQKFSIRLQCVIHELFVSDSLRLRQIFLNILSNACKFTPLGGSITMDVAEVGTEGGTAYFIFTITDTGIGMQPEFIEHLFTAFSREKDSRVDKTEGTGLGMAITKRIAELLEGTIEVESEPGKGSVFSVRLPLKIEESPKLDASFPNLKIIVADDDAVMCEYTVEMLQNIGIYADWVDSGEQAVAKVLEAQKKGEAYDAILLDWKMPGQDGLETTRRLREVSEGELPILIISAYDWNDIEQEAKMAGVSGFLQKPIFASTLIRGLRQYILGESTEGERSESEHISDFGGRHFLLVEDNALNREVAQELLGDMGAVIDTACDGLQGIKAFAASEEGFYDILLMDIQMPVMDGYTAARTIRTLNRTDAGTVPILAMTADAFAEDIRAAKDAGMDGHLAKPLDGVTLKREISKYLV